MSIEQVQRYWRILALLSGTLIVHLVAYLIAPEVGNSRSFLAVAVSVAIFCAAIFLITWLLNETTWQIWRDRLKRWQPLYLILLYGAMFALSWLARPEWFYVHLLLILAVVGFVGYWTLYAPAEAQENALPRGWQIVIIVSIGVILLLRLYTLSYEPWFNITDEPWTMSWAVSYQRTGTIDQTIMLAELPAVHYYHLVALWFELVGIGLYQGRLIALLFIIGQIILIGDAARRFFNDRQTGYLAALFMALSAVVIVGARVRHDAPLAFAVALAIWFYSHALQNWSVWYWHFLAGTALGLGAFGHYHASGFGVALVIGLYFPTWWQRWRTQRRWFPERALILFGLGGLIGFFLVFLVQILPTIGQDAIALTSRNPQSLQGIFNALRAHIGEVAKHSQWELMLAFAAIITALWHRETIGIRLVLSAIGMHIALSIMASNQFAFDYYSVPIMPLYIILIARMMVKITQAIPNTTSIMKILPVTLCAIPLFVAVLIPAWQQFRASKPIIRPAPIVAHWVEDNVSPDERIVTEHVYYIWLYDYNFLSPSAPFFIPADDVPTNEEELFAFWDEADVTYFIHDPTQATSAPFDNLVNSDYLASRGYRVVEELGQIVIYGR